MQPQPPHVDEATVEAALNADIDQLKAEAKLAAEIAAETASAGEAALGEPGAAETEKSAGEADATPATKAQDIMAAAAKAAEDPCLPMVSSRMLMARSLVARQEQLHDRLTSIRRQFADIDFEVTSLRNSRYAHYANWEERRRQQSAHAARAKLLAGRS